MTDVGGGGRGGLMGLEPLMPAEAAQVRVDMARAWGLTANSVVVSELGYPPVPEAKPRTAGRGGWIPESVPVEYAVHPVWWLEDSSRLRRVGEDDDDYAGRLYWDLVGRGLIDGEGGVVDVAWRMLRIDVDGRGGRERVTDWLGGEVDSGLSGLWVPGSPHGFRWAEREAGFARPQLEARLEVIVGDDLGWRSVRATEAAARFEGSTAAGVVEPLVDAVRTYLQSGRLSARSAVGEAAREVKESVGAAVGLLAMLCEALGEPLPAGLGGSEWGVRLDERVGRFYGSPGAETGNQLYLEAMSQAAQVCEAGLAATARWERWEPPVKRRKRSSVVVARAAADIYGPPPVVLSAGALARGDR